MVMQAVGGFQGWFISIYAGWAGSTHHYRSFNLSNLRSLIQAGDILSGPVYIIDGHIVKPWPVGDAGFALQPWMITHILAGSCAMTSVISKNIKDTQSSTRMIVEQTFGHFKARFRRLAHTMQTADLGRHRDVVTVA